MDKPKKKWYKRWWAITIWMFLGVAFLAALFGEEPSSTQQVEQIQSQAVTKPAYDLEMSMEEIFDVFRGLSDLQVEEKVKEFEGKRIKSSIIADRIDKATLSTQYVAMEMYEYPYSHSPYAKAFFPQEEKDKLLKVNLGDRIIFSGEFVTYKRGALTSYIEFTKSKFIGIEQE